MMAASSLLQNIGSIFIKLIHLSRKLSKIVIFLDLIDDDDDGADADDESFCRLLLVDAFLKMEIFVC